MDKYGKRAVRDNAPQARCHVARPRSGRTKCVVEESPRGFWRLLKTGLVIVRAGGIISIILLLFTGCLWRG
jgi:hypothetical protein